MLERNFQANLIQKLKRMFPGCIVMKNDASYKQGIPDLLVLYRDRWASLECKKSAGAKKTAESRILCRSDERDVVFSFHLAGK